MATPVDLGDAQTRLAELAGNAEAEHVRYLIRSGGRPVAAIVSVTDLERLGCAPHTAPPEGLLAAAGALADFPEFEEIMRQVVVERAVALDRDVDLE